MPNQDISNWSDIQMVTIIEFAQYRSAAAHTSVIGVYATAIVSKGFLNRRESMEGSV
jgi:hypothetical protein